MLLSLWRSSLARRLSAPSSLPSFRVALFPRRCFCCWQAPCLVPICSASSILMRWYPSCRSSALRFGFACGLRDQSKTCCWGRGALGPGSLGRVVPACLVRRPHDTGVFGRQHRWHRSHVCAHLDGAGHPYAHLARALTCGHAFGRFDFGVRYLGRAWSRACDVGAALCTQQRSDAHDPRCVSCRLRGACRRAYPLAQVGDRFFRFIQNRADTTSQTFVRLTVFILIVLAAFTAIFDLDIVLGAFAAGFVLRFIIP